MPIKPENKGRYPKDWAAIRDRIMMRARGRCEECGVRNGLLGGRCRDGTFLRAWPLGERRARLEWPHEGQEWWCGDGTHGGRSEFLRIFRIVLTVAHLDHTPEHCDDDNLRAWCQRCHLRYDARHHAQTAYLTRRQGRAVADLFEAAA